MSAGRKVFVLNSRSTGSGAELLAHFHQDRGLATVVGENAAGRVLSSAWRCIDDGWVLRIPVSDYLARNLQSLERNPVEPDIELAQDEALKPVIELTGQ